MNHLLKRFWILLVINVKALRQDPLPILGGFIAPLMLMIMFGLLFGGELGFQIAVVNQDTGPYGKLLRQTFDEIRSPLNDAPYYTVVDLTEEEAQERFDAFEVEGIWIIPPDFSERLENGENPAITMIFNNYHDDRAKNHRIYSAEVLWRFYEKIGQPAPPLALAEEYPLPYFIHWFPIIGVGTILTAVMLGGLFNAFVLTFREREAGVTMEFGLMPRSLAWVFLPKTLLALLMALLTGTLMMGVFWLWEGAWPSGHLGAVWLLFGLVALFWIALAIVAALGVRDYFVGAVTSVLTGLTMFFIGGGLSMPRYNAEKVVVIAWLFPNTYAVDPLRDLILFGTWPADWNATLFKLAGFAVLATASSWLLANRRLRRLG